MRIRRTLATLALAALALGASATSASAHTPTHAPPSAAHTLISATSRSATHLTLCKRALIRAHHASDARAEAAEYAALRTCVRLLTTDAEVDALYTWASTRPWAMRII